MRIAIWASGSGSNMQALVDYTKNNEAHYTVNLVLSNNPNAYVIKRAIEENIPYIITKQGDFETTGAYGAFLEATMSDYQIDLVALAGFLETVPSYFLTHFKGQVLNIHPSLLPAFGGKGFYGIKVHEGAMKRGVKLSGATVHRVTGEIDGGAILAQEAVKVLVGDTPESLQQRILENVEWVLYPAVINQLAGKADIN